MIFAFAGGGGGAGAKTSLASSSERKPRPPESARLKKVSSSAFVILPSPSLSALMKSVIPGEGARA